MSNITKIIISKILPPKVVQFLVEIGANEGVTVSTSLGLILGGRIGISVEANVQWWYKQNMFIYARPDAQTLRSYRPTQHIRNLVHPELLQQIDRDLNYYSSIVRRPKFYYSLKLLIKSILKKY
jgi:hypothetical protein